jgi:hypothetical protein
MLARPFCEEPMPFALAGALIAASVAVTNPPEAYTGMDYSQQCGNGPPGIVLDSAYCDGYLVGFYDALAASGMMCRRRPPTDRQIAGVVQNWLRRHSTHPGNPTGYMIRNGLLRAWGCR